MTGESVTNADADRFRLHAVESGDVPWVLSIVPHRSLQVDVRPGVDEAQWDELLDAIIRELPGVDRVRFRAPELTPGEEELLNTLLIVLEKRGLDVERL
jgi:hypothetical protein